MSHGLRCWDLTLCHRRHPAVERLQLHLPWGALVGIVGPNGAGKTTLLHGLLGLVPQASGGATLDGVATVRCRRRFGFIAQRRTQASGFPTDVAGVVTMGRCVRRGIFRPFSAQDRAAVEEALARMGLDGLRRRPLGELSGGEQQRVLVARALATGAEVLLLDEPLAGLDRTAARDLLDRLRSWTLEGRMVLAVLTTWRLRRAGAPMPCCSIAPWWPAARPRGP